MYVCMTHQESYHGYRSVALVTIVLSTQYRMMMVHHVIVSDGEKGEGLRGKGEKDREDIYKQDVDRVGIISMLIFQT